jgi:hypothetical protein
MSDRGTLHSGVQESRARVSRQIAPAHGLEDIVFSLLDKHHKLGERKGEQQASLRFFLDWTAPLRSLLFMTMKELLQSLPCLVLLEMVDGGWKSQNEEALTIAGPLAAEGWLSSGKIAS